jgi:signal transduction histidine kinase
MFSSLIIDFNNAFNIDSLLLKPDKAHLINLNIKQGLPRTYYFHFSMIDGKILAIGQQDPEEGEKLRTSLLDLNNELNNLTRQLNKKNAALEKLDDQKNQFFGMAAHDIRHPLSVISMFSEFLAIEAKSKLTDEQNGFISDIQQAAESMEQILNDFLDFSIIESGHLLLNKEIIDIIPWLEQTIRGQAHLAQQQKVSLKLNPYENMVDVKCDSQKMAQVVNNLLSNAIKFSPENSCVEIGVETKGEELVIFVKDQGPGIDKKDHDRIFSPFERIVKTGSQPVKGSGIGLVLVKKIIDAHQGRVWVESELGKGAAFFIAIPLGSS